MSLKLERAAFGDPVNKGKILTREEAETLLNILGIERQVKAPHAPGGAINRRLGRLKKGC